MGNHGFNSEKWHVVAFMLMIYDFITIAGSYIFALLLRFDFLFSMIDKFYLRSYYSTIVIYALLCLVVYWFFRLYKIVWRFASYGDVLRIIFSTVLCGFGYFMVMRSFISRMPYSYYIIFS